jgi:hypothetical protein
MIKVTIEDFSKSLTVLIRIHKEALDKWAAKFAQNPAYAMKWAGEAFEDAAKHAVATEVLCAIEQQGVAIDLVRRHAENQALKGARYPERSTSPSANEAARCETAAWAEMLERIDEFLRTQSRGGK